MCKTNQNLGGCRRTASNVNPADTSNNLTDQRLLNKPFLDDMEKEAEVKTSN